MPMRQTPYYRLQKRIMTQDEFFQILQVKPFSEFPLADAPHAFIKELCQEAAKKLGHTIDEKTRICMEHKRHHMTVGKAYNHGLAIHRDSDDFGMCYTVLYYYQVDDGILNNYLEFFKPALFCRTTSTTKCDLKQGDIITFEETLHKPSDYRTHSTSYQTRAFIGLFIMK